VHSLPDRPVVLVVEEDQCLQEVTRLALEDDGFAVLTAGDGHQALQLLSQVSPQLILLDLSLPLLDGPSFLEAYRAETPTPAPVVVCSGALDVRQQADQLDADDVLPKPFELSQLLAIARTYIGTADR
jgi:DNA-binding response OmpR family regulator